MTNKLREYFEPMIVYKDLKNGSSQFSSMPSFLRDWILKHYEDEEGHFDIEEVSKYLKKVLPKKEEWQAIKSRLTCDYETIKILTKISVDIEIKTNEITFSLPEFGLTNKETTIEPLIWDKYKDILVQSHEIWGTVELGYRLPSENKKDGRILLKGFKSFCPYKVDLEYYQEARSEFTLDEWLDVLLGAIDYNAAGYKDKNEKLAMLTRLLPFVEKRLNLMELAPKGTGKSYLFGHVSHYGMLMDGGKVTRASMFYNAARGNSGFVVGNDFVAIDEVKLVQFNDINEMRSILQGYMEYGSFTVGGHEERSDAGIVFLGNIDQDYMDEYKYMLDELPTLFKESALLDRIHGFICGWTIPRMHDDLKLTGWALNSEYFSTVLHLLRDDISYRAIVDKLIKVPPKSDTRDTEAVKRLATAYLKLLFPQVRSTGDITGADFKRYCLNPAMKMRYCIMMQMGYCDSEFKGKNLPEFTVNGD